MNGSRANPPRYGDRSSFDALNRTIEGLEARIEGLMGGRERGREAGHGRSEPPRQENARATPLRDDPVGEIMQRQRALEAGRERQAVRSDPRPSDRYPSQQQTAQQAAPDFATAEIARALVGLRQDLKRDISDGLGREMDTLRAEMRAIRQAAEARDHGDDVREDLQRLAQGINQLGRQSGRSEADGLRVEFDQLRSVLDGLAREDSVRRMEGRWNDVEQRLTASDQSRDDELVALAYRLDELKAQIQTVSATPALRDLERQLHAMGQAVEALGRSVQQDDRRFSPQFEGLDLRLDEISRAIAASGRAQNSAAEAAVFQRIEGRIGDLADQLDAMARRPAAEQGLGQRLETLAYRIEEMTHERAAIRLEERLDQLSAMIEQGQRAPAIGADLTHHLTDISRKIDALDQGAVNDVLAERLDHLARRIDELDVPAETPFANDRFSSIESRLQAIAERLDRTGAAPADDGGALRSLEAQIANLSTLISKPSPAVALPSDFDSRMATIEDYMATNDEYIIEAARQAAETVMQAYQRHGDAGAAPSDMAAISALAEDLRTLEDVMRSSEDRTARTFEALHDTLVQIAGRLEQLDAPGERYEAPHDRYPGQERQAAPAMPPVSAPMLMQDEYPFVDDGYDTVTSGSGDDQATDEPIADREVEMAVDVAGSVMVDGAASAVAKPAAEKAGRTSLIAGLARRFAPAKEEAPLVAERQQIDPAPSIDPGDEIAPEVANQLLEPGSGAPDVRKILERVRANQAAEGQAESADAGKADFIAAARRAARMAAEETDPLARVAPEKKGAGSGAAAATFGRHRRPILMAVGAILLAIMSYPLVNTLVRGDEAPKALPVAQADIAAPETADAKPAAVEVASQDDVAAVPVDTASVEILEEAAPAQVTAAAGEAITKPMVENTAMDTASPALAVTGAEQLTRPADNSIAVQTGGFEPVATMAKAVNDIPPGEQAVASAGAPSGTIADVITVPPAIEPASLAKSAGDGDSLALFEIGARYTDGRGVSIDMAESAKWYALSAERGFAPAQYRLGSLYEKGQGVERDLDKARSLYELSARQGNASAMHNLAVLLATGGGKAPDFAAASEWFKKAADLGVRDSQFNLAILYARGNGVPVDLEESYKWFAVAARDGDRDAAEKRDEVANAMKPEQLSSAKAKLELWKEQPLDDKANSVDLPDEWVGKGTKTASVDMKKAVRNIQAILNNNGFDAGTPDGSMGPKTVQAIKAFQKTVGQPETGKIDDKLVNELLKRNKPQG
ncbi:localization factor PodJL [Mycoplana sp. BE70]|uniref:peptidoglycan-binding protein n=1 Tax=Mycoplana sp. BE70 TaxID=2817775 RepID=UPI0028661DD7|nr:peptidoglycan-binding protein [Mycoplana sp. BE70]MDR6754923.1 localization factor PodJL [Mycoplana sp. BE70]